MMKDRDRLTLSFMTYQEIAKLESQARIKRILDVVLTGKIVILQGRLDSVEETSLIQTTMALVGRVKGFKGVELAVIDPNQNQAAWDRMKLRMARALVGQRYAFTIIGPASIVKEIKRDPKKIELMLSK